MDILDSLEWPGLAYHRVVIAQDGREAAGAGGGTMQHAFAAAAFRQRRAVGRHQPAAKARGAPVDDHEGCGCAAG